MLQVTLIKQKPDWVKERLAIRNFKQPELVDEIIALDEQRRSLKTELDEILRNKNLLSKEIGNLIRQGKREEAEAKKKEVEGIDLQSLLVEGQLPDLEERIKNLLEKLPNLPSERVPAGNSAEDNVVVREGGKKPQLSENALPHWELIKEYNLVDFETGAKITGSGFPLYKGKGARLQRALIQYFLDYNTSKGYTEYLPPFMVNEASAYATGQLPDKEGQMYHVTEDNLYLIPTSEVPLTNIYRDVILKESDLPIRMTAYSPCFRREAGSFGKDVRGLNRVHQFEKVEIVQLVYPQYSYSVLDEMVHHVEGLVQSLALPYRILKLCGGDMGFTSALTYDFEVYSAAQQRWLEVSSVSNFENYQTNRMKCRFKDANGKMQLVHSLNGSSLALPRIMACLLENNQTDKCIRIPEVLQKYYGSAMIM